VKIQIEAEPGELHAKGAALLGQLRRAIAADAPTGHTCGPACGHGAEAPDLEKATRIPKTAEAAAERLAAIPLPTVRTIVERAQAADSLSSGSKAVISSNLQWNGSPKCPNLSTSPCTWRLALALKQPIAD
jgi:hypothetical protein